MATCCFKTFTYILIWLVLLLLSEKYSLLLTMPVCLSNVLQNKTMTFLTLFDNDLVQSLFIANAEIFTGEIKSVTITMQPFPRLKYSPVDLKREIWPLYIYPK